MGDDDDTWFPVQHPLPFPIDINSTSHDLLRAAQWLAKMNLPSHLQEWEEMRGHVISEYDTVKQQFRIGVVDSKEFAKILRETHNPYLEAQISRIDQTEWWIASTSWAMNANRKVLWPREVSDFITFCVTQTLPLIKAGEIHQDQCVLQLVFHTERQLLQAIQQGKLDVKKDILKPRITSLKQVQKSMPWSKPIQKARRGKNLVVIMSYLLQQQPKQAQLGVFTVIDL